jgi:hypothetical protein
MNVKRLATDDPAWAEFVSQQAGAMIFHHPAWVNLLSECYGYGSFVLAALDARDEIEGGMPFMEVNSPLTGNRWISLPFSDICLPLCRNQLVLNELVKYLVYENRQGAVPRIEIHANLPSGEGIFQSSSFVWSRTRLCNNSDVVLRMFDRTRVRQPIQQATRRGVEVHQSSSKADMFNFYDMFVESHQRLGAPVQPKRFFSLIWDRLIEKGFGFLSMAYKDGLPIAGNIFLHHGHTLTLKYNASRSALWQFRPNHLLYWAGIKWGCENGYKVFDFGRTELDNRNLREFKQGWAAEEVPLIYTTISKRKPRPPTSISAKIIGDFIRRMPLSVCRVLGEILYRHYA